MLTRQSLKPGSINQNWETFFEKMWNFYAELILKEKLNVIIYRCIPHFASEYIYREQLKPLTGIAKEDIDPIKSSFLIDLNNRQKSCFFYSNSAHKKQEEDKNCEMKFTNLYLRIAVKKLLTPSYFSLNKSASDKSKKNLD